MADDQIFAKPLEKMTVKELRDLALTLNGIVGVHSMKKEELMAAIKEAKGIVDEEGEKKFARQIRQIKADIRTLREKRDQAREKDDKNAVAILRRRISRLKKQTRNLATA